MNTIYINPKYKKIIKHKIVPNYILEKKLDTLIWKMLSYNPNVMYILDINSEMLYNIPHAIDFLDENLELLSEINSADKLFQMISMIKD